MENINSNEKFCTKCGKKFIPVGREVICPACKQAAAEESKRAAVLRAKRASWSGESVPVRISGRASTVIRKFGEANSLPFAEALDELLKSSAFFKATFKATGREWGEVVPYKSHRRDKSTATSKPQDVPQGTTSKPQDKPQDVQDAPQGEVKQDAPVKPAKQAAKKAASMGKTAAGKAVKKA